MTQSIFESARQPMFKAPFWAKNRHFQTIWPRFFCSTPNIETQFERYTLPDDDFVDLAWSFPKGEVKGVAVVFHGLEGSIDSHYIKHIKNSLTQDGWISVLMHFRGCSGVPNRLPRYYHSGETQDARHFLDYVATRYPDLPRVAVGYSLGGNMLLKLLGESGSQLPISAAVAISAPMNLSVCADSVNRGFSKIYQHYLIKRMARSVQRKIDADNFEEDFVFSLGDIRRLKRFRCFDEKFTAPLHGFKDAQDYYDKSSAVGYLSNIQLPTLIIHAKDDPFMDESVLPQQDNISENVLLEVSEQGGHVGFLHGTPWKPKMWLNWRVPNFFNEILCKQ
jgi:predicted alpha/beta-fold hydrolase